MRNKNFIAAHRGGLLSKQNHKLLLLWAIACVKHILPFYSQTVEPKLTAALNTATDWVNDLTSVGTARNAALNTINIANQSTNKTDILIARSIGHAVATSHMADHSLRAADYALKVVKSVGQSVEQEKLFQNEISPAEIYELVMDARK